MKLKTVIFRVCLITICFLFSSRLEMSFSQEQNIAFEQALKNYDNQKQKDLEILSGKLNHHLNQAVENWLSVIKKDRAAKLNTRLKQEWEKLSKIFAISSIPYEYDLRGYKYIIVKSDVIRTDSLSSPYKAVVVIKEELYVEKNHSPDISNASPYFYTVSTNYTLNFEYRNEKFDLINSDNKIVALENQCPDDVKRWRL